MINMELRPWNNIEVLCNNLGVVAKYVHIGERIYTPIMCHTNHKQLFIRDKIMMQCRILFNYSIEYYFLKICQESKNWIPRDGHIVLYE